MFNFSCFKLVAVSYNVHYLIIQHFHFVNASSNWTQRVLNIQQLTPDKVMFNDNHWYNTKGVLWEKSFTYRDHRQICWKLSCVPIVFLPMCYNPEKQKDTEIHLAVFFIFLHSEYQILSCYCLGDLDSYCIPHIQEDPRFAQSLFTIGPLYKWIARE